MQTTNTVLMIRPVRFAYNDETAVNNKFQLAGDGEAVQVKALNEFDAFVDMLRSNGIDVTVINDTPDPHTPDSIFPNNWISFHEDGTVVLYPMFAGNRRAERKQHVLDALHQKFNITNTIDLTGYEDNQIFLEGTGSMVLDRENKIVYACKSQRTNEEALKDFCERLNYTACLFSATDANGAEIYHTNVMMCVADKYVVICLDSIKNYSELQNVTNTIIKTGKKIISISIEQMNHFAGNMLQVKNNTSKKFLIMSKQAFNSLSNAQIHNLGNYNEIIYPDLITIETNGGGSARCTIAEVFLPAL